MDVHEIEVVVIFIILHMLAPLPQFFHFILALLDKGHNLIPLFIDSALFQDDHLLQTCEVGAQILAFRAIHFVEIADFDDDFQFLAQVLLAFKVFL